MQASADEAISRASRHGVILMGRRRPCSSSYSSSASRCSTASASMTRRGSASCFCRGAGAWLRQAQTAATTARGHPRYALRTVAIVTPLTLALYLVLAPAIGATGAAFGSTISYAITTIVSLVYVRRVTVIPFRALAVRVATDLQDHAQALRRVRRLPVQRLRPLP
jgi:hypothetical protein